MSDNKDSKKSSNELTFPPPAHVRVPHGAGAPVLRSRIQPLPKQDLGKKEEPEKPPTPFGWLVDADKYEPPTPPKPDPQKGKVKDVAKKQSSSATSGSLDWLRNADLDDNEEWPKST